MDRFATNHFLIFQYVHVNNDVIADTCTINGKLWMCLIFLIFYSAYVQGPSEDSIEEQYERYKLKNKKPKRGQTAPDPTPNQREVLKILSKHVNPCVIL